MNEETAPPLHTWLHDTRGRTFSRAQKLILLIGVLVAFGVANASQRIFNGDAIRGFSASVLQQGSPARGALAAGVAIVAGTIVTMLLARRIRPDAGLFCAALGLLYFRFQGSSTRFAIFSGGGRAAYLTLAIELAILSAVLLAAFALLYSAVRSGVLADDATADGCTMEVEKFDQKLLCTLTVAVVTTAVMMILCQSDRPGQAIWAVFIASFAGTWCAFRFIPVVPSVWYWTGPLIAGIAGYLFTYSRGYQDAEIGQPLGYLGALARAMPLDYASVGVAGSLIGYWGGRRHHRIKVEEAEAEAAAPSHEARG